MRVNVPLPHPVHPKGHLVVHADHPRGQPLLKIRRPRLLLADGRQDLRHLPGHRGQQPVDREDHQHLPALRLPEEREQGGDHLQ